MSFFGWSKKNKKEEQNKLNKKHYENLKKINDEAEKAKDNE